MAMNNINNRIIILLGAIVLVILLATFLASAENDPAPSGGEVNGDWVVTDARTYEDCTITLTGNLMIKDGGALTFRNVTLKMNCTKNGERKIEVEDGGKFLILDKDGDRNTTMDGSIITAVNGDYHFLFIVNKGSEFEMRNSFLSRCGYYKAYLIYDTLGLYSESNHTIFTGNKISSCLSGLVLNNTQGITIDDNRIENMKVYDALVVYNSKNITVENNSFQNFSNGAPIWIGYSEDCLVKNNQFLNVNNGIHMYHSDEIIITHNEFSQVNANGVILAYSSNCTITKNEIESCGWNGLKLEFSQYNTISDNFFSNFSSGDCVYITLDSENTTLFDNTYYGCNVAIFLNPGVKNTMIEFEDIASCRSGLIIHNDETIIRNISISNSTDYDLYIGKDLGDFEIINVSELEKVTVRESSTLFINNYLSFQTLNSTGFPLPGVDILIEQDGAPVYSTSGFGGTDPETDTSGKTPQLVLTDRVINATSETGTNTTVTVRKGNWQETRIVNTSISHTEVFRTPVIEFEHPGVTPDSGDQDTVFNFTVTLSAPAEYCRLLIDSEEFGMIGQVDNSYYLGKTLGSGDHTYSFAASNSLEVFSSPGSSLTVSDTIAPPPVSGLTVSDLKNGTFLLSWSASIAEDFDHYRLYYSTQNVSTTQGLVPWVQVSGAGNTTIAISGLDTGTTYYFAVTAVDAHGNENQSIRTVEGISEPFLVKEKDGGGGGFIPGFEAVLVIAAIVVTLLSLNRKERE